jgi:hypothetical protein
MTMTYIIVGFTCMAIGCYFGWALRTVVISERIRTILRALSIEDSLVCNQLLTKGAHLVDGTTEETP